MTAITTNPETFYVLCSDLLADAVTILQDNNLTLPTHRFVSWHEPAWDCCDHLVTHVSIAQPSRGRADKAAVEAGIVIAADITLTFVGCAAVGDPLPTDTAMNSSAEGTYTYAWVIYQGLACLWRDRNLFPSIPNCEVVKMGHLSPKIPQGGCQAFTIRLTVDIM